MLVVNVNPQYTPRELEHQLADSGARAIVVLENFAHTVQHALPKTDIATVIVTRIGDHCPWLKRLLVNFAVKHVRRMVPTWSIPHAVGYRAALEAGPIAPARRARARGRRHRLPPVHGWHDGSARRVRC